MNRLPPPGMPGGRLSSSAGTCAAEGTFLPMSNEPGAAVEAVIGEYGPGTYRIALASLVGEGNYEATLAGG